jgi:hypothetical protein
VKVAGKAREGREAVERSASGPSSAERCSSRGRNTSSPLDLLVGGHTSPVALCDGSDLASRTDALRRHHLEGFRDARRVGPGGERAELTGLAVAAGGRAVRGEHLRVSDAVRLDELGGAEGPLALAVALGLGRPTARVLLRQALHRRNGSALALALGSQGALLVEGEIASQRQFEGKVRRVGRWLLGR